MESWTPASSGDGVFLWELQWCWWAGGVGGGRRHHPALARIPREEYSHLWLFRSPSQRSGQSPVLVPGFHEIPALNLSVPELLGCLEQQICVFISGWWFKTPNLKMPGKVQTHSPPLEESLAVRLAPFCPRKGVAQCAGGAGVYCGEQRKADQVIPVLCC